MVNITTIVYNDVETDCIITRVYGSQDRAYVDEQWEVPDEILAGLQNHPVFEDYERWCDLTPIHFRVLIARNFDISAGLPLEERGNPSNPVVESLSFLALAYVKHLEQVGDFHIEHVRITRISRMNVQFTFSTFVPHGFSSLMAMPSPQEKKGKPNFRMVVDNQTDG